MYRRRLSKRTSFSLNVPEYENQASTSQLAAQPYQLTPKKVDSLNGKIRLGHQNALNFSEEQIKCSNNINSTQKRIADQAQIMGTASLNESGKN